METDIVNMLLGLNSDDLNSIRGRYEVPESEFMVAVEDARSLVSSQYGVEFSLVNNENGLVTGMTRIEPSLTNDEKSLVTVMETIG